VKSEDFSGKLLVSNKKTLNSRGVLSSDFASSLSTLPLRRAFARLPRDRFTPFQKVFFALCGTIRASLRVMSAEDVRSGRTTVFPGARTFGVNPKTCPSAWATSPGAEEESATTNAVSTLATVVVVMVVLDVFKSLVTSSAFAALVLTTKVVLTERAFLFCFVSSALLCANQSHAQKNEKTSTTGEKPPSSL